MPARPRCRSSRTELRSRTIGRRSPPARRSTERATAGTASRVPPATRQGLVRGGSSQPMARLDGVSEGSPPECMTSATVAVILAVTTAEIGGDGWESNPPGTPHSAPQTVLKTAGGSSGAVHKRPLEFIPRTWHSVLFRLRAHTYAKLAVILAVSEHPGPETSIPSVRSESLATPHHAVVGAVARRGLDVSAWRPYAPEIQVGKVGGQSWRGSSKGPISKTATATSCVPARSRACRRPATGAPSCSYSIFREDRSTAWTSRVIRSRLLATRRRSWVTSTGA